MGKTKYAVRKEFFPFNLFSPPMSRRFVCLAQKFMKTPKCIYKNPQLDTQKMIRTRAEYLSRAFHNRRV